MIGYRCKCGKATGSSSMGFEDCQGCEKCGTTYAAHPDYHKKLQPHKWGENFNQNTGKPYKICEVCHHIDIKSYEKAKKK